MPALGEIMRVRFRHVDAGVIRVTAFEPSADLPQWPDPGLRQGH
jgi:hypothetical protein